MNQLLKSLCLSIVIIAVASCRTIRQTQTIENKVDSVVVIRDRVVYDTITLPKEVYINILPADSVSHLETTFAESDAFLTGGVLQHSLNNKDVAPIVYYTRDTLWRVRTLLKIEKADTIVQYKTPWYDWMIIGLLLGVIGFLGVKQIFKI
jgi:hypothetical protein